ncbi:sensor histidine kinase [Pararhizobium antarcticum]|uniref:histidine kinase n=1 Tax=Pararhizobium antarcticum TaxID=1798805 RepID=A0A657LSB8_9HYPH|nr:HWE histidine kinase domain-containing protein [Pararhizobium antarcticum]OJF94340.1 histidine kinase [Rhizobium sp. 58]OJF96939.1 histidine kinase [Pararhizobium antarcticum]
MNKTTPELPAAVADSLHSAERLDVLQSVAPDMRLLDPDFDSITHIAADLFRAPVALVSLIEPHTQWFKSRVGTEDTHAPSLESFCAHTIAGSGEVFLVPDACLDPRFAHQPRVAGEPFLRFYAGVPVIIDGQAIGTVCVFDVVARPHTDPQLIVQLHRLSALASSLLKLKDEARKRALKEAALSRDGRRHAMALDAANVGSWLWDIRTGSVAGNGAMNRLFNLPVSGAPLRAKDIFASILPDDRVKTLDKLRDAMAQDEEYDGLFRVRSTGRWLLGRGRVHERDADGRPTVFLGINLDVTDEQSSIQRTRLLLRELNHRVKNTLAMLQSLARQTLRQTSDPHLFMKAFSGRLQAISEAHGLLSDHEWGEIRLSSLFAKQISPYARDYDAQVEIHKDDISLGPDQAVGLGLVLHELATNAAKYGALSTARGKIVLTARSVTEETGRVLHLTWTEVDGPPVHPPERRGFGSILIERSLDKVLGSSVKVEYLPAGVTAIVRLPL